MSQSTHQRREQILNEVLTHGHVKVKDLAEAMGVSEATIRRDLRVLESQESLELEYGGAALPRISDFSFRSKTNRNMEAKRAIGQIAASLVEDGETIFLDSGTTVFAMTPWLKRKRGLSIIFNSVRLATELGGCSDLTIFLIGGQYRPERMDTIGPMATETLGTLRGFRTFIGADGLSPQFGVSASDIESAHLYRRAILNARETLLLVDHTKFLAPSLFRICEFDGISRVITDEKPSPEWLDCLSEKGIDVLYPDANQGQIAASRRSPER